MDSKKIVKEDINFLEYPNWTVNERSKCSMLKVERDNGKYAMASPLGLPNHYDKIVLYYLLSRIYKESRLERLSLLTTRYEIAKNVLSATHIPGKNDFERIMLAIEKWKAVSIKFEGIFYEGDSYKIRGFSIIDDYILDKESKQLYIKFNQQYIEQLKVTKFYKYIDFNEYKKLKKSISARLYEILIKNFKERSKWHIGFENLAQKLTLEKRSHTRKYYASDILSRLNPAIKEINEKTDLFIELDFSKDTGFCTFKNKAVDISPVKVESNFKPAIRLDDNSIKLLLTTVGISSDKAEDLVTNYTEEQIRQKVELLKQNKSIIKSPTAWLVKALKEDWGAAELEKQKQKEEAKRKREEQRKKLEEEQKRLEQLKVEHDKYIELKVMERYKSLPLKIAKIHDAQFFHWLVQENQKPYQNAIPEEKQRVRYFKELLLENDDLDFEQWALAQGHKLIKANKQYRLSI
jgi:hypothetical protein